MVQIYTQKGAGVVVNSDWFLGRICFWKCTWVCKAAGPSKENWSSIDQADPIPLLLLPLSSDDLTKISFRAALAEGELINRRQLSLLLIEKRMK